MTNTPIIETAHLSKRFGERQAVFDLNLEVSRGSAFGFLGHNGAGKTTLIRMLLGLTAPTAGTMHMLGRPLPEAHATVLARVGAIVEEPHFHGHLTGRENLRVIAAVRGPEAMGRIDGSLSRVGLLDRADNRVRTYSQGMRQRLGVARCLLADPELLILDEPMNGLDPAGILELRGLIRDLVDEGRTVMLSSHLLDEVEKTCDAAAIVDNGRIVAQGSISELRTGGHGARAIDIDCDSRTLDVLDGHPAVINARETLDGLRVVVTEIEAAASINTTLVESGVPVFRLEPVKHSLEQRFLEITSRVGEVKS
jgi:ABC-2 type transport system ATP-binding protein